MKFFCRGFSPKSFERRQLKLEFFQTRPDKLAKGSYPSHVGEAVFDRLHVIHKAEEWERCLVVDHDQLPLCDFSPFFEEDFDGNLLMGRLFGSGNILSAQMVKRGGLPSKLKHTGDYPYFYMGPMMNLKAMRHEGTWQKLLRAHKVLCQDEQMALTVATEGRVKGVGRKWNLVPHWDNLADGPEGPEGSHYGTVGAPAIWKNGVPEGIIHWTGSAKPWDQGSGVWRPDLWESEETSWEALRNGWWEKPVAALMEPSSRKEVASLARRGWKVYVFQRAGFPAPVAVEEVPLVAGSKTLPEKERDEDICIDFPDVHFHAYSSDEDGVSAMVTQMPESTAFLRIGPGAGLSAILEETDKLPETLVLQGPLAAREIKSAHARGYVWESRLKRDEWPAGGPDPSVLTYSRHKKATGINGAEDVYLRRCVG